MVLFYFYIFESFYLEIISDLKKIARIGKKKSTHISFTQILLLLTFYLIFCLSHYSLSFSSIISSSFFFLYTNMKICILYKYKNFFLYTNIYIFYIFFSYICLRMAYISVYVSIYLCVYVFIYHLSIYPSIYAYLYFWTI